MMNPQRPSCAVAIVLMATQVLGPAVLWAADQRGIRIDETRRVVVAALSGDQLTAQSNDGNKPLHFLDVVNVGDQLATGHDTKAEVLIGNRAVVTLGEGTTVQLTTVSDEQTTLQVSKGLVRVAAAASALGKQGMFTVETPTGQAQTRGGIMRVLVDQPTDAAEHPSPRESKPYLASYSAGTTVAALTPRSAIVQVEEGSAEILAGVEGKASTLQAGQAVTIRSGQVGTISKFVNQAGARAGVLATAGHSQTPKEGLENLVARQVEQATALGKALTGAAETGQSESGKKDDNKNVINGATGGVTLASGSLVSSLFGGGSTANPTSNIPQDRSGIGQGAANNNGAEIVGASVSAPVSGGNGLLVFTRKDRVEAVWLGSSDQNCLPSGCTLSVLTDPKKVKLETHPITSNFTVAKELLLIGGTPNDGHGGIAPYETLIVRGAAPQGNVTVSWNVADTLHGSYSIPSPRKDGPSVVTYFGPKAKDDNLDFLRPPDNPFNVYLLATKATFVAANSDFVVKSPSVEPIPGNGDFFGGTLGQFSNVPEGTIYDRKVTSFVDAAITTTQPSVVLKGGVTLDRGTIATIGTTAATTNYFAGLRNTDARFTGSLLAVIGGFSSAPDKSVSLTLQDRILGVYDGSTITGGDDKALLSVLDAQLTAPGEVPLIDVDAVSGLKPTVNVGSAVVIRANALDAKLLSASAPLLALTSANMTTKGNFGDLAGTNGKIADLRLSNPLVALNASTLMINNGHLLNLNAATATVNGYLFSLNNGSTLTLNHGALFSVTNGSSLNLTGNAFGVFGSGTNTFSITNNLCAAACGQLVNSAGQAFTMPVGVATGPLSPILVAGTTQNVVLPNGFHPFATTGVGTPVATTGNTHTALFQVDGTSTLTIHVPK